MKKGASYKIIMCFAIFIVFNMIPIIYVHAGDINANEQSVIGAASGIYEYEGKKYKVDSSYIAELKSYLMNDDVDLTSEQANKAIAEIENNLQTGISDGYMILINEENIDNTNSASEGKEDLTQSSEEKSEQTTKNNAENTKSNDNEITTNSSKTETSDKTESNSEKYVDEKSGEKEITVSNFNIQEAIKDTGFSIQSTMNIAIILFIVLLITVLASFKLCFIAQNNNEKA